MNTRGGRVKDKLAEANEWVPDELRHLQACMDCGLILTRTQWEEI